MNTPTPELDGFERLLRDRLHDLADHAPTTVPALGDIRVGAPAPRRGRRVAGIGATIAVIAGGVGLTTISLQGAAEPGGADTPEAAVREFAQALAGEDLLGMIDVALPEEVDALRAAFDEASAEAKRLGLLDDAFALDGVIGVDVTVDELALRTDTIASDLAAVTSTDGRLGATFDAATFPLGRLIRDAAQPIENASADRDLATEPFTLVTLRRESRWYVSLGMTIAESIRTGSGAGLPDGLGLVATGASSPEAAAEAFYERLAALDLRGAATLAAPGEGDVFRRYASLWLPDVEHAIAGQRANGLELTMSGLELRRTVERDGRVTLVPDQFVVEGTLPGGWSGESVDTSGMPDWNPEWPTLVDSGDGRGVWILEPGVLPETVDEIEGEPLPYESDEVMAVRESNFTWVLEDGSLQPFGDQATPDAEPVVSEPTPFRIERIDGCTVATGSPFFEMVSFSPDAENLNGGTIRACDGGDTAGILGATFLLRGSGSLLNLPSLTVVEDDGEWFVSPIGTIAAQALEPLRALPDDVNAIDVPFLPYALGAGSRADLDRSFAGATDVGPECEAIVEADGSGGFKVVADPAIEQVRRCADRLFYSEGPLVGGSIDSGVEIVVESELPPAEELVPASTAPAAG